MDSLKNKNPFLSFIYSQKYFLKFIYKEHPKSFMLFFILSIIASAIPPLLIIINKNTIDTISVIHNNPEKVKVAILLLFLTFIMQYFATVLDNIEIYIFSRISQTVNFVLKKMMLSKLINMRLEEYEDSSFFDIINLANTAISGNGIKVISSTVGIVKSVISLIGILGILLSIHWTMPLALFLSTLPGIIIIFIVKTKNYNMSVKTSTKQRELSFTDSLFINKSSIKEIKINNLGVYLIKKWSVIFKHIQKENLDIELWEAKTKSLAALILQLSSLGVSILLVNQITHTNLTIGDYVALLGAVTTVQVLFSTIGANLGSIFETAIFNNALIKILNYNVEKKTIPVDELSNIKNIESISLENVSFLYPKTNETAIDRISLNIKKGENISIVGYNGSGKTTLIKCLLGLYDVSQGSVKINGLDMKKINKENLYKKVSVIFQDFFKYKYSVRENLGFGDLEKLNNDKELENILKDVGLHEKVNKFEQGLETYLTREIPEGSDLSGGEWQRIAIARGFLKDSDLIILDEPTAAVDPITELRIFEIFNILSKGKTTITISHRLGPTKFSDRIIVMENGKIKEEGNYKQLMEEKGLYYRMYLSQSNWYNKEKDVLEVAHGSK
ncbi:ATP-binding cassette subfamily B protein [Peribacillus simplex]